MRRLHWSLFLVAGGLLLGSLAGCTPKPSTEQLALLERTCATADNAEAKADATKRDLNAWASSLAQKRQTLKNRQNYQKQVRTNLKDM
jgi:hypothetical protein